MGASKVYGSQTVTEDIILGGDLTSTEGLIIDSDQTMNYWGADVVGYFGDSTLLEAGQAVLFYATTDAAGAGDNTTSIVVTSGDQAVASSTGNTGAANFKTGDITDASASGQTGSAVFSSGSNQGSGDSGSVFAESGSASNGDSAPATFRSGTATNGTSGEARLESGAADVSGDVRIRTGTGTSTRGDIKLLDGTEGNIGDVWTSKGIGGQGNWAAIPSSADNLGDHTATQALDMSDFDINNTNFIDSSGGNSLSIDNGGGSFNLNASNTYIFSGGSNYLDFEDAGLLTFDHSGGGGITIVDDTGVNIQSTDLEFTDSGPATIKHDGDTLNIDSDTAVSVNSTLLVVDGSEGTAGQALISSDTSGTAGWAEIPEFTIKLSEYSWWFDHYLHEFPWSTSYSGTGASAAFDTGTTPAIEQPGIGILSTGTTTSGRANHYAAFRTYALGNSRKVVFQCRAEVPTSPDGTDDFIVSIGAIDQQTVLANVTAGMGFLIDRSVSTTNWLVRTVSGAGPTETVTDTGIAFGTDWADLRAECNAAGTSVEFYIDDVLAHTETLTITITRNAGIATGIYKVAGTNNRTLRVDYAGVIWDER